MLKILITPRERKERKGKYKNHFMTEIKHLQMTSSNYEMPILANVPNYIGGMEKPEKAHTISNLRSRFKGTPYFRKVGYFTLSMNSV